MVGKNKIELSYLNIQFQGELSLLFNGHVYNEFDSGSLLEKYCNGSGMDLEYTTKQVYNARLEFTFFD